jgi:hypothetical protein
VFGISVLALGRVLMLDPCVWHGQARFSPGNLHPWRAAFHGPMITRN